MDEKNKNMRLVAVKDSKQAVMAVRRHFLGKRIRINDVFAGQTLMCEEDPYVSGTKRYRRRLFSQAENPNFACGDCLEDSGYRHFGFENIYWKESQGNSPPPLKRMERCKAELEARVSRVGLETEAGMKFSFAFREGCCSAG